jgi:hypothetical protein
MGKKPEKQFRKQETAKPVRLNEDNKKSGGQPTKAPSKKPVEKKDGR